LQRPYTYICIKSLCAGYHKLPILVNEYSLNSFLVNHLRVLLVQSEVYLLPHIVFHPLRFIVEYGYRPFISQGNSNSFSIASHRYRGWICEINVMLMAFIFTATHISQVKYSNSLITTRYNDLVISIAEICNLIRKSCDCSYIQLMSDLLLLSFVLATFLGVALL